MNRTMKVLHVPTTVWRRAMTLAVVAGAVLLPACGEDATGLSDRFMIRRPVDSLFGGAATFRVSATGTSALDFEWEPVTGADSYSIIFSETSSADSMNTLQGDLSQPTLTFDVTSTTPVEVLVNPSGDPDGLRVRVVQHTITAPEFDAALVAAGVEAGGSMNTIYAIVAHRGSASIRSVEVQRLTLRRE